MLSRLGTRNRHGQNTPNQVGRAIADQKITADRGQGGPSPKCAMTAEAGGEDVDRMRLSCTMEDGGWPSEGGLQDQPSNRPTLLGDKLPGGERIGKRQA